VIFEAFSHYFFIFVIRNDFRLTLLTVSASFCCLLTFENLNKISPKFFGDNFVNLILFFTVISLLRFKMIFPKYVTKILAHFSWLLLYLGKLTTHVTYVQWLKFYFCTLQGAPIKNNPLAKINYLSYSNRFFHQIYIFYRGCFRPHRQQISLLYLLWFKNYHYLNLKVHFYKWTSNYIAIRV